MIKYGIDDIRNYYANDLRFLGQFAGTGVREFQVGRLQVADCGLRNL